MPIRRAAAPALLPVMVTAVLLTAALLLAGCNGGGPAAPAARPVTIGLLVGDATSDGPGQDAVRGAELALAVINQEQPGLATPFAAGTGLPGLGGTRLRLAVADTGGDAESAESAMDELARVAAVVAADRASVIELAGAYADRREIPMVDGATTAGFLLDLGLEWYFRTGPTDRVLVDAVFAALPDPPAGQLPPRVTVFTPDGVRGADVARLVTGHPGAARFEVTEPMAADGDVPGQLGVLAPDLVVAVAPAPGDGQLLHDALRSALPDVLPDVQPDVQPPPAQPGAPPPQAQPQLVVGLGQGFTPSPAGPMPPGMVHAGGWSAELAHRAPLTRALASLYQDTYGTVLTEPAARAYTATMTLATAVDAAGTTEPVAVRAALRQLSIPATHTIMPWNGIRFGETGQNELAAAVVEQARTDGTAGAAVIYPPELAARDLTWQVREP